MHQGKSVFSPDDVQEALKALSSGNARSVFSSVFSVVFSVAIAIATSLLNDIFSLIQTKHKHGFLTKCSKLPLKTLWFVDRMMKGINLILNRSSDREYLL